MQSSQARRPARDVNEVIDRALQQPTEAHFRAALHRCPAETLEHLAERIRRRGTRLTRRERRDRAQILRARDRLILAVYAHTTPAGWHTAWCDGSIAAGEREAGIGGIVMDPAGRIVVELARRIPDLTPFDAEVTALVEILGLARVHGVRRLRVYSDCAGVVQLWHRNRSDPRLAALAAVAPGFRRLEIRALPRLHNQPAHRLAKSGAGRSGA